MQQRLFRDFDNQVFRVHLAPFEQRRGVNRGLNALVYETEDGRWIGSVPVYHSVTLEMLTDDDLEELLEQAMGRG